MTIENRFNLVVEPWIPIADVGRVSLRQIFSDPSYRALGGNPIQKIAITKLLLAIAQAAYTPKDNEAWELLGSKGLAQNCLTYFVSSWVKFQSPEWLDGTIMQYVLIHPQYSRWDDWVFIDNPLITGLLAGLAEFIRWWELLFPFLLINTYTRRVSLLIGILFHLGLLLTMNLRWFPVIMLSLYPALLSNSSFLLLETKLINYCRGNQVKR